MKENIDFDRAAKLLENIDADVRALRAILQSAGMSTQLERGSTVHLFPESELDEGIEGIFDGERMVCADGKTYQVSANYASKSKLVEGDPLKLYINSEGRYFYKQLGPVERKIITAQLMAEGNNFYALTESGKEYNLLTATVTYYISTHGVEVGDSLMFLIPADTEAVWATIDNVR